MGYFDEPLEAIYERNKGYHFVCEIPTEDQARIEEIVTLYFRRFGHSAKASRKFAKALLDEKMYTFKDFIELVKEVNR